MTESKTDTKFPQQRAAAEGKRGDQQSPLVTSQGKTTIADAVVAKIAGMAAREVSGVHDMGAGAARAFGAVRDKLPGMQGQSPTQGVSVEVGERQAAVDIDLIVEYGVAIPDMASAVRKNVVQAVERMCGLEVVEVNINVGDVHLPGQDDQKQQQQQNRRDDKSGGDGGKESRVA
ncbi:Asp23/Gls24 family envelope stress response protein [Bailinhaonella thermotolerans]|uniref:Asp23/Gls24 family envelope stress response protein n=1 Tax=Bailinhaonella thermotolerans TaxID=1070861 RepID=A0A3A4B6P1_9ACTN|nr:Asp23/Gls24 family envelope stress response protein [Bailinhaonella thermotolerans]RJL33184.1 Asp23/Gls24 family envelope stress response protein [Bailinhaonella thermotolerans]